MFSFSNRNCQLYMAHMHADNMHHQWLLLAACFWVIFMFMVASKFITLTFKDPDGKFSFNVWCETENWIELHKNILFYESSSWHVISSSVGLRTDQLSTISCYKSANLTSQEIFLVVKNRRGHVWQYCLGRSAFSITFSFQYRHLLGVEVICKNNRALLPV